VKRGCRTWSACLRWRRASLKPHAPRHRTGHTRCIAREAVVREREHGRARTRRIEACANDHPRFTAGHGAGKAVEPGDIVSRQASARGQFEQRDAPYRADRREESAVLKAGQEALASSEAFPDRNFKAVLYYVSRAWTHAWFGRSALSRPEPPSYLRADMTSPSTSVSGARIPRSPFRQRRCAKQATRVRSRSSATALSMAGKSKPAFAPAPLRILSAWPKAIPCAHAWHGRRHRVRTREAGASRRGDGVRMGGRATLPARRRNANAVDHGGTRSASR